VIKRAAQIADRLLSSVYREGTSLNLLGTGDIHLVRTKKFTRWRNILIFKDKA
jgi:hypothetical protein